MALRPAGRAFSSGLARVIGWPGGATGRRIALMIDPFEPRARFRREDFIGFVFSESFAMLSAGASPVNSRSVLLAYC